MNAKQVIIAILILSVIAALFWFFISPKASSQTTVTCSCTGTDPDSPITQVSTSCLIGNNYSYSKALCCNNACNNLGLVALHDPRRLTSQIRK